MNKVYRLIWSDVCSAWVTVSEITKGRGKRTSGTVSNSIESPRWPISFAFKFLALALAGISIAQAAVPFPTQLPTGGNVSAGSVNIAQSGTALNINQTSQSGIINWQTFNIGSGASVNYIQPSSSSVTLNRVLDTNPSQIYGSLNANGQVFFTNPNGMYFAPSASVNVGGLVATTHSIADTDFLAGNYFFNRNGATGSIANDGNITAALGGYIALLAPEVRNNGVIVAQMGTVALAAGEAYTLQFNSNNKLANIDVSPATIATLVQNGNAVKAPGGLIILSAQAVNSVQGSVVNNSGTLEAGGISSQGGRIVLDAGATGSTNIGGTLDVSSTGANGGQVVATGQQVLVADGAKIDATGATGGGTINIGGGWQGGGGIAQATNVYVSPTATLDASATNSGNGGTISVWSDVTNANSTTRVYGTLLAQGGVNGGNGGNIETSGHWLDVAGITANASALNGNGNGGEWLLDPYNITIAASGASGTAYSATYTSAADSIILASDIMASLNLGTSVSLTTGTGGSSAGTISVTSAIAKTAGGNATLTLKAARDVMVSAPISSTVGKLNVVLWSDYDQTLDGGVRIGANITTNGGNFWAGSSTNGGSSIWNGLTVGNAASVGGVGANWNAMDLGGNINTGGGNVLLWAGAGYSTGLSGIGLSNNYAITAGAGNVTLLTNTVASTLGTSGNTLTINSTGVLTIAPPSGGAFSGAYTWNGTTTSGNLTGSGSLASIIINGVANLSGLTIGQYTGTGLGGDTVYSGLTNTAAVTVSSAISANGPISVYGGSVALNNNLSSTASGAAILISATGSATTGISTANTAKTITTNNGNISLIGDSGGSGLLDLDYTTMSAGTGNIDIRGATMSWATGVGISPTITSTTGTFTFESSAASFGQAVDTSWFNFPSTLSGFTVGKSTNTQAVSMSTNALSVAGPINIYGSSITDNVNLISTLSGAGILLEASAGITQAASTTVQTNGGDITYWSNSAGATTGGIYVLDSSTIDSRTSADRTAATNTTGGGTITLAGGTTTTTTTLGTTVPTGYAENVSGTQAGLILGTNTQAGHIANDKLYSGGGNITLMGESTQASVGITAGISTYDGLNINAGTAGNINITGLAANATTSTVSAGIDMDAWRNGTNNSGLTAVSLIKTVNGNLNLTGTTTSTNSGSVGLSLLAYQNQITAEATGTGAVTLTGIAAGTGAGDIRLGDTNILAASGAIQFLGNRSGSEFLTVAVFGGETIGWKASSDVTSSSSNITFTDDSLSLVAGTTINTTGTVTVQPYSTSFTSALTTTNLTLASTISGLTLGKSSNTAAITVASAASIAGPINIYGGNLTTSASLTSTLSGAGILLKGTGSITDGGNITTSNGDITLWSNSAGSATGGIQLSNNVTLSSTGGWITMGGSAGTITGLSATSTNGTALPQGYAASSTASGIALGTTSANTTTINSGGGNVNINGNATATSGILSGVYASGVLTINSGSGAIALTGASAASYGMELPYGVSSGTALTLISSKSSGTAISLTGTTTAANSYGIVFDFNSNKYIEATGGGAITINGTGTGSNYGLFMPGTNVLATTGAITVNGGTAGIYFNSVANTLGALTGTGVTSSSSNITLTGDIFNVAIATAVATTGTLTVQPYSTSFSSALTTTNFSLASTLSALTLGASGNTANITVGSAASIAGPINIYGGNLTTSANLTSTLSGAGILLKGTGSITDGGNITTSNGDITLWSNSAGSATGGIQLSNNVTLSSTGGWITLGGSANNATISGSSATSTNGTTLPQGYAENLSGTFNGVVLGTYNATTGENANVTINSGNGKVSIAGQSNLYTGGLSIGLMSYDGINVNAGTGDITLNGLSTGATAGQTDIGFTLAAFFTGGTAASKWQTNGGTITLNGTASGATGTAIGADPQGGTNGSTVTIENTSTSSGSVTLNGSASNGTTSNIGIRTWNTDILSKSGAISLNANIAGSSISQITGYTTTLGYLTGSDVTAANGNVTLTADAVAIGGTLNINSTGALTVQPYGTSFTSTLTWPASGSSGLTGLTLGKVGNTAGITISSAQNIAGPINIYGGPISITNTLSTGSSGAAVNITAIGVSGSIAESGSGLISTTGVLTTNSVTGETLGNANTVGSFNATNTTSGNIALTNTSNPLIITGMSNTGGGAETVSNTGAISITGTLAAAGSGAVNLTSSGASGAVAESGSGLISTTGLLTTNSVTGETLNNANTVGSFHATNSTSGNIALTNTATTLTITGMSNTGGGTDTINNTGAISITGTLAAAGSGAVNLTAIGASGAIAESGSGLINTSGTLTTNSVTGETLNGANTVAIFNATNSTSGNIALTNTANPLVITGMSNTGSGADTVSNTGVIITLGALTSTGNLTLTSTSNVLLDGNVSIGGLMTVNATGNFVMGIDLGTAVGMTVAANGGFASTGAGTNYLTGNITTSGTAINFTGPVQVANFNVVVNPLTLSTGGGNITLNGAVSNYSGTAQNYAVLMDSNLYSGITASTVSGSSTDVYVAYSAGSNLFLTLAGLPTSLSYLLVGGGGGGGNSLAGQYTGGGGGGGGVTSGTYSVSGNSLNITVGAGGALSSNGGDSSLGSIYVGGGGGGGNYSTNGTNGSTGLVGYGNNNPSVAGRTYVAGGGGGGAGSNMVAGRVGGTGTAQTGGTGGTSATTGGCCTNVGGSGGGAIGNALWNVDNSNVGGAGYTSTIIGNSIAYGTGGSVSGTPVANTGGGGGAIYYGTYTGANGTAIIRYTVGNATTSAASALKLSAGAGSVSLGSTVSNLSSLEVNAGAASTITGAISGTGSTLTNSGAGILTVNGAATYTGATAVTSSGIVFANNATPTTSGFTGAGTITIQPGAGSSFTSPFTPGYTYASSLTGLTLGSASNTTGITISSATSINGPITIDGGPISITNTLSTGSSGASVNITAAGASGAIAESGSGLINTTGTLTTHSVTGETLNGANTVGTFNAANTTSGNIALTNTAAPLTITGISETGGNISVGNTGALSTSGVVNTTSANGSIGLTSSGIETIGAAVTANGSGTVTLTANGAASDVLVQAAVSSTSGAVNVTAGRAITESGSGTIGTSGLLTANSVTGETLNNANTVGSFNAANTTSGNIALTNTATTLTITGISESGGNITVGNTGAITTSTAAIITNSLNGTIGLTASGIETIGAAVTANGSGTVSLTANGATSDVLVRGAVSSTSGAISVTAGRAITESGLGTIGTSGLLTTNSITGETLNGANAVGSFNATNSTSGNIALTNTAVPLTITGISETGGNITVGNTGALSTSGIVTTTSANGTIGLTATSGSETIGAAVTANGSGSVTLVTTGANDVLINAAVSGTSGAVNVTSGGAITEGGAGAGKLGTSGLLTTHSVTGEALSNANTIGSFNAANTTSGNIALTNTATTLTITGISESGGNITVGNTGAITTSTAAIITNSLNGTIGLTSNGIETIGAGVTANGSGTVSLTANGATSDVLVQGAVSSTSGAINVTAGRAITESGSGTIGTSGLLTTSSVTGETLGNANTVGSFNATNTTSGNIALTNTSNPLIITGMSNTGGGAETVSNTGAISITGTVAAAGGGAVNLTSSGASGAVAESGSGLISTTGLLTTNSVTGETLNNANTVGSFHANNTTSGNIALTNTAAPLTITGMSETGGNISMGNSGAVTVAGVINSGAGTVSINASSTLALNAGIATTNNSASAIMLNAGYGTAAGTSTGGDITVSGGSLTYGAGGRATLYTGSVLGSTASAALAGISGSGMFRYDSNATTANYTAALGTGTYEIYREQPTLTIAAVSPSAITYGSVLPTFATTVTGVNGDTGTQALSTQATVATDGIVSTSGNLTAATHTLTASSAVSQLGYTISYTSGSLVVNKLALTGSISAGSSVYGSALSAGTVSFTNAITNDVLGTATIAVNTTGNTSTSGNLNAGSYTGIQSVTALSGADAGNYTFAAPTGNYTVSKLALTGSISAGSSVYGSALSAGTASFTNIVGSDALGTATITVNTSGNTSTSGNLNAGSYTGIQSVTALSGADAGNYTFAAPAGNYTVSKLALTGSISAGSSVYGSALSAGTASFTNAITNDVLGTATIAVNTNGNTSTSGHLNAGSYTGIQSVTALSGADAGNYTFAAPTGNYTVSKLALTGSISAGSSVYGSALSGGTASFTNAITNDVLGTATIAVNTNGNTSTSGHLNAGSYTGIESVSALSGADAGNYTFAAPTGDYVVSKLALSGSISAGGSVYGSALSAGTASFTNTVGSDALGTATITVNTSGNTSTSGNLKAGSYTGIESVSALSGADAGNYTFATPTGGYAVSQLALTVGGVSAVNKVYDGTTNASLSGTATVSQLTNDVVSVNSSTAVSSFANANVANTKSVTVSGYALSGADSGNYSVTQPSGLTANITPASLTVTANSDAKFVTQADTVGYNGVNFTGFVNGETSAVLGGTLAITRSNSSTSSAGTYTGVLIPTGYTANNGNYNITYANGNYTIVPADQLLVKVSNTSSTYGIAPTYSISAQYLNNSNVITTLTQSSANGNTYTYSDTASGSATFTLVPTGASTSTSGNVVVGNYLISGSNTSIVGSNFNALNFTGNLAVTPAAITPTASNVSKTYDGTTSMSGVTIGMTGLVTNDIVTINGTGAFSSKNAGTGLSYSVNNISLTGQDSGNYYLSGGTSLSGSNGVINQLGISVTATAANKVYDGNTSAIATLSSSGVIAGDTVNFANTSANFANKNVGSGVAVMVSGISASGTDSGNYTLNNTSATTSANITQLSSVTWTGGASGNWFDPANWAGGAVPDLSNVANVVIPGGVTVTFNNATVVSPAQAGTVNVNSIGSSGSLNMIAGALNVSNSMQLNNLGISGGTLGGTGNVTVNSFNQSGGTVDNSGSFTVNQSFTQTGGNINVGGNVDITQANGAVVMGNISTGGNLNVTANSGDVSQTGPLNVAGTTNIAAGSNNVMLAYAGNSFGGDVNVTGNNVTMTDTGGGLVIGTINSSGNLVLTTTGGPITQANGGTITVTGTTDLSAATNGTPADITVGNQGNSFGDAFSAIGQNVTVNNRGGNLTLGNTSTSGSLTVNSNGNIAQRAGTAINAVGYALFTSATGNVVVANAGNSFSGGSSLTPSAAVVPPPLPVVPSNIVLPTPATNPPPLQQVVDSSSSGSSTMAPNAVGAGTVSVTLNNAPTMADAGMIAVTVPKEMATAGSGFSFALPAGIFNASSGKDTPIVVETMTGQNLPGWLRFNPETKMFTATAVPDGAFPMQLKVSANGKVTVVVISQRAQ